MAWQQETPCATSSMNPQRNSLLLGVDLLSTKGRSGAESKNNAPERMANNQKLDAKQKVLLASSVASRR